ncbi:sigma-54-dependent Fis family transcriptional regulator [Pandoraea thiooxydans]|uniref:Fis family transcriptional regulator n=1 Tax=Pandoraea thiooxydans TaxID=445709 RepID=A0A0G3EM37_9BURK|nr:sigma-54-dependent Fis family transcriptional regulator [Pandoraea thiooxydans]AKJ67054.1 sigma-54-dependent Fis family transcriptional regulator [Pandoraea thiooxydans]
MPAHLAVAASRSPSATPSASPYLPIDLLCGVDAAMQHLIARGKRFIDRGLPVLILGETGTGKEYLARALHSYSQRRARAMVAINCASIPEHLIESELFGYARGAFSGALPGGMKGRIQQADGGTLFLDEIGDMPLALQTRLLRVLSEREVTPLGSSAPVPVDVQLICATHQDLPELVAQGRFREDLYYRIAVGVLRLPPLRERTDFTTVLARMLADELQEPGESDELGDAVDTARLIAPDALEVLARHRWPGNLRQLKTAVRYACAVMSGPRVELRDLPAELLAGGIVECSPAQLPSQSPRAMPLHAARSDCAQDGPPLSERERVLHALTASRWNISAAARTLGVCRASLYRKLKQLRIPHMRDCASELVVLHGANA